MIAQNGRLGKGSRLGKGKFSVMKFLVEQVRYNPGDYNTVYHSLKQKQVDKNFWHPV